MKKLITAILTFCLMTGASAYASARSKKSSITKSNHSGTYKDGTGSSHKGGNYKNSSTNNHYKKENNMIKWADYLLSEVRHVETTNICHMLRFISIMMKAFPQIQFGAGKI